MRTLEFHFTEALMLMGRDESGAILRPKLRSGIGSLLEFWALIDSLPG
jgi:hypothetical protein